MFALFFFNDTATTEIYTLSLHDALPIYSASSWDDRFSCSRPSSSSASAPPCCCKPSRGSTKIRHYVAPDRKSTRLNSSHLVISYAVFCLKKKKHTRCYGL